MKTITNFTINFISFIIMLWCVLFLCSCEKSYPLIDCGPPTTQTYDTITYIEESLIEGDWLLTGGKMFMENLDLDYTEEYFHFDSGNISSLRYGGSQYEFEDITRYSTIWSFDFPENLPGVGIFLLDYDSIQPYGLNVNFNNMTIIEDLIGSVLQLGGSSRPLQYEIINVPNRTLYFYVQESYENINGYNCRYYSKLKFKKIIN